MLPGRGKLNWVYRDSEFGPGKDDYKIDFWLLEPKAAQNFQNAAAVGLDFGRYNKASNSCITHCADVLRAGGLIEFEEGGARYNRVEKYVARFCLLTMEIIMVMPDTADDYKTFIEILASRWTTLHHVALTGEMIKATAEFNSFLAGMKGKMRGRDWIDFANRFEVCEAIYEGAWVKFKASKPTDWPSRESAIEELDDAFQRSADSMRTIVEDAHGYEERLGEHGDFADLA